ncbi:hypothetical protein [Acinetobacter stercoris]|uniref:Transglycosylase SLT domain-containing protein n=1 Tax=Acinetobacter stercoris TaxID=2126983 RepID=A0A2U3N4P4_9GAMM|nr:hypothetical protein [Acinetobacter stercoris]SPL72529.1 hypothetical protein KPC_3707 [Acinetobacter stercoris]
MPKFNSIFLPYQSNQQSVIQCFTYGKLSFTMLSLSDGNQRIPFKIDIKRNGQTVFSSFRLNGVYELPKLEVGTYTMELFPKRDETFFWYKNVPLRGFNFNFEIQADKTTYIECLVSRVESIIYNIRYNFLVKENSKETDETPFYEISYFQEVVDNLTYISSSAARFGVDEDLIKSIIYMESTHGYYDAIYGVVPSIIKENKSIRPTNINVEAWPMLFTRAEANNVASNIDAGAYMLRLISDRVPDKDISKIASIYNSIRAETVFKYGLEVMKFYRKKPWNQIIENQKIYSGNKGKSEGEPYHGGD